MHTLPKAFEERIKKQLPEEADVFLNSLQTKSPTSIRLNLKKIASPDNLFTDALASKRVEWCDKAWYLNQRPIFTLDPCLHGGAYYVQEASSMFIEHIIKQVMPPYPIRALDLCAAPGGKSTLIASMLNSDSLLVSNEVIRSRASILKENIIKWGQDNIVVTSNDPADFKNLEGAFDMILVDAPCSGEGMFRKDSVAIQEWSENNLQLCKERQQRILADIWNCLKPGGVLIYSTCTYNPGENEEILEWLMDEWQAESIQIEHSFDTITQGSSKAHCYHFYPHKTEGEGFFTGVIRKIGGKIYSPRKNKKQNHNTKIEIPTELKALINNLERYTPYAIENLIGIVPSIHSEFIDHLSHSLRVIYRGCELAEMNNRKVKLRHALALSQTLNQENCAIYDVDRHTALTFLRKEEIPTPDISGNWLLISYQGIGLGWCKNLGNRLNNYYPKEWRIRMELKNI